MGQGEATKATAELGVCMSYYCTKPAMMRVHRYGVDQVLCQYHADEPIICPKCGCSSPCRNYGPGCP